MTVPVSTAPAFGWFMPVYTVLLSYNLTHPIHTADVSLLPATEMCYTVTTLKKQEHEELYKKL